MCAKIIPQFWGACQELSYRCLYLCCFCAPGTILAYAPTWGALFWCMHCFGAHQLGAHAPLWCIKHAAPVENLFKCKTLCCVRQWPIKCKFLYVTCASGTVVVLNFLWLRRFRVNVRQIISAKPCCVKCIFLFVSA